MKFQDQESGKLFAGKKKEEKKLRCHFLEKKKKKETYFVRENSQGKKNVLQSVKLLMRMKSERSTIISFHPEIQGPKFPLANLGFKSDKIYICLMSESVKLHLLLQKV